MERPSLDAAQPNQGLGEENKTLIRLRCIKATSNYPLLIAPGLLQNSELLRSYIPHYQILIVSNTTVASLYLSSLQTIFSDRQCDVILLPDGEDSKSQAKLFEILSFLVEKKHHRDTCIIGLGGGVITDIAAFAASIYQRGVDFMAIPTSLLAQVDAAIGGKTAINLPNAKNMVGSFYQPKAVFMDTNTLNTLPAREYQAGLAEIIKYAILKGGSFFNQVESALEDGLTDKQYANLPDLIQACCLIKAAIVEEDERETGKRALLNLGHTLAHALEVLGQYHRWLHGEAVAIGLYFAALLSHHYYGLAKKHVEQIDRMLKLANLPRRIPKDCDADAILALMAMDKKIKHQSLHFVVIRDLGFCEVKPIEEENLKNIIQAAQES